MRLRPIVLYSGLAVLAPSTLVAVAQSHAEQGPLTRHPV